MNISTLKSAVMASDIGPLAQSVMTLPFRSRWESGQRQSTFLKLTAADARAFEEYQSMLRLRSSLSSRASADRARLKKLPKPGDTFGTVARRPCPVI